MGNCTYHFGLYKDKDIFLKCWNKWGIRLHLKVDCFEN